MTEIIVQCKSSWCGAYGFCSHAKEHAVRKNCFNCDPEERKPCPKCHTVMKKDGL